MDFNEEQRLSKTKASLLVLLPILTPLILYIVGLPLKTVIASLIVTVIICIVGWLFLRTVKLVLSVNQKGISFQIKGLQRSEKILLWDDIKRIEKVSIKPLREFGGWGLRFMRSKTGYIFEGETGVELFIDRNSSIVITIRDTESFFASVSSFQANL